MSGSIQGHRGVLVVADLKFIHAADIHLGRPFSGLEKWDPELGRLCRKAGYTAWERIIQGALDHKVDFVTLAGDVFDSPNPSVRARVAFRDEVLRLYDAGIPVFMALGNHDSLAVFPQPLHSLPGLHVFGPEPEGVRPQLQGKADGVMIFGASFERPVVTHNLVSMFRRDPGVDLAVGVVHANVSSIRGHLDYAPCTLDDLKSVGMDAWCLGHVHARVVLSEEPLIFYPGAGQGAHVNETGPHGYHLVRLTSGKGTSAEFISAAPVVWSKVDVDVSDCAGIEDVVDAAGMACRNILSDEDTTEAFVVRIHLIGSGSPTTTRASRENKELLDILSERLSNLPVPVFPESIRDLTALPFDPEVLLKEEGFLGDFLKLSRGVAEKPADREELFGAVGAELMKRVSRAYLSQELEPERLINDPHSMSDLLQDAENLVTRMFFDPLKS